MTLGRMVRLNWLRYRAAWRTLPHLADRYSKQALLGQLLRFTSLRNPAPVAGPNATEVSLRIRDLGGRTIHCRRPLSA